MEISGSEIEVRRGCKRGSTISSSMCTAEAAVSGGKGDIFRNVPVARTFRVRPLMSSVVGWLRVTDRRVDVYDPFMRNSSAAGGLSSVSTYRHCAAEAVSDEPAGKC